MNPVTFILVSIKDRSGQLYYSCTKESFRCVVKYFSYIIWVKLKQSHQF